MSNNFPRDHSGYGDQTSTDRQNTHLMPRMLCPTLSLIVLPILNTHTLKPYYYDLMLSISLQKTQ
jgi:hypothetical protein